MLLGTWPPPTLMIVNLCMAHLITSTSFSSEFNQMLSLNPQMQSLSSYTWTVEHELLMHLLQKSMIYTIKATSYSTLKSWVVNRIISKS